MGRPNITKNVIKIFNETKGELDSIQIRKILDERYAIATKKQTKTLTLLTRQGILIRRKDNGLYKYRLRKENE